MELSEDQKGNTEQETTEQETETVSQKEGKQDTVPVAEVVKMRKRAANAEKRVAELEAEFKTVTEELAGFKAIEGKRSAITEARKSVPEGKVLPENAEELILEFAEALPYGDDFVTKVSGFVAKLATDAAKPGPLYPWQGTPTQHKKTEVDTNSFFALAEFAETNPEAFAEMRKKG